MKKILQGAGASALAAATVVTGLSFGPAAMAAPAPAAPQANTVTSSLDGKQFYPVYEASDRKWVGIEKNATGNYRKVVAFSTKSAAQQSTGLWKFVEQGDNRYEIVPVSGTGCLTTTDKAFNGASFEIGACSTASHPHLWGVGADGRLFDQSGYLGSSYYVIAATATNARWQLSTSGAPVTFEGVEVGMDAKVDSVDVANRSAKISGTAKPSSKVVIGTGQEASVDSAGKWSAELKDLNFGANKIHLENRVGTTKSSETDITVTLDVTAISASASAGASNTDDVTLSGIAHKGAAITITGKDGKTVASTTADATTGAYSTTASAPNAAGTQSFTVTQALSGAEAGSVSVDFDYGTGVSITAPANGSEHPGAPIDFAGRGQAGGTITIRDDGKQNALGTATVQPNGTWSIPGVNLDDSDHNLVVSQLSKGNNTTTAKVTIKAGIPVIAAPVVDSPVAGSTVDVSRPVFTGHGQPGAKLTIGYGAKSLIGSTTVNASGEWTITPTSGLALGESKLVVVQTSGTDVQTVNYTINRVAAAAPFAVTSHANNEAYAQGVSTFRGTGAEGATITAKNQWGTVMGTAKVTAGQWAFSRNLGPTTDGYDITFTQTLDGKSTDVELHLVYAGALSLQITSPVDNSTYKEGNTTFTGHALPGTKIVATNQWGTQMGSTTADLAGDWSFVRYLGPTTTGYDITFVATKGADTQRTQIHLNPTLVNVPVTVTSVADGDTYRPGQNILKGTGTPGATVSAVNATNGWNVPMGSAKVDATGAWELPERNWGPSNDYAIKVTQTNPDKTQSTVTVNIKAPVFQALTVDDVTIGGPVGAGINATFTGKATAFAEIQVKSANTGSAYQTVTADKNGNWTATRTWDPSYTYNLTFAQKALDGGSDSVDYGSFTAKNAE